MRAEFLTGLGGEEGCIRLSSEFYKRVAKEPILRPLFPGKSLRCATEEFASFLIQFLGGDEKQTQHRWWLSLRESHARFKIGPAERAAWLKHMEATLDASPIDEGTRTALREFFRRSSSYVMGKEAATPAQEELAARWTDQKTLDETIAAISAGNDKQAIELAPPFGTRPAVFIGLLARMMQSGRPALIQFAIEAVESNSSLKKHSFSGRTLLHFAGGAGCVEMVTLLLRQGADPNVQDRGGHPPLYRVANECVSETGPAIVKALVRAGADVNASGGVTRATPLHMAARRGFIEIARTLLDHGGDINSRDSKGDTPLQRAINCRKAGVAELLRDRGASR